MPINGLTNVPKAFLRLGHIRKGEKDENGYPRDLDYFRVTFNNQPACEEAFREAYGEKPVSINIRLAFPNVADVWDANYEAYSKGGLLAKAASTPERGLFWVFYRRHDNGEVLVRNGIGVGLEGTEFAAKPINPEEPIYSYKNKKGENVPVLLEPVGRLNVVVPEIAHIRVGFLEFRAGSTHDIMAVSRELAAIDHMARQTGKDITGIPMRLTRQPEDITKNIGGQLSRGESWMVHIEVGGEWGNRALETIDRLALPAPISDTIEAEVRDVVEEAPEQDIPWETLAENEQVVEDVNDVAPAPVIKKKHPEDQSPEEERPYTPAVFKKRFDILVNALRGKYKDLKATDNERKVMASAIDGIFNGDKTMRYEFCKWLTGAASSKDMSPYHIKALMTVMEVKGFDDPPNEFSMVEIRSCHSEALREMGQAELPMEAQQ